MGKICEFYRGKNVLVTGATGFCGKILVEKLLRSCEGIGKIFIIVRAKKNASPQERYVTYINHMVFNSIREANAEKLQKIIPISGDLSLDGLNLSSADEETLINQINVIFHCAGNVRFDEPIKTAINNNVMGTWRVLQLAEKIKNLEVFSHMSTAFSKCFQFDLEERYYPSQHDVFDVIKKVQKLDDEKLQSLETDLLASTKHPNTYTLSKAFGEDIVNSYRHKFPIVIFRPSLVWPCVNEPIKGFMEGLHSGMAVMCGVMTGFVRNAFSGETTIVKFTPVDYVISATIASAWKRSTTPAGELLVFNCTESDEIAFSWRKLIEMTTEDIYNYPPYEKLFWYPRISVTSSKLWRLITVFLFQILPAMFIDSILMLLGKKAIFTKLQIKILKGFLCLDYFVSNPFNFETIKLRQLFTELDEEDQKKFFFDHSILDLKSYLHEGIKQIRRLLLKEDDATLPKAREKLRKLYYADLALKGLGSGFLLFYLIKFGARLVG